MNPDPSKLRHRQEHQQTANVTQSHQQTVQEFASVEELIRYDAQQTEAPAVIAERLNDSIAREPKPLPWWKRLFS